MPPEVNPGARPTTSAPDDPNAESTAAAAVQGIFNSIAPSYDLLNHLLSMGLDRRWWNRTACTFAPILRNPNTRILDLCCGTGDQTAALLKLRPTTNPGGPSFALSAKGGVSSAARPLSANLATEPGARPELAEGSSHLEIGDSTAIQGQPTIAPIIGLDFSPEMLSLARLKYPTDNVLWVEGDAMHLPYPDNTFDLVTAAFGFRNLTNYAAGLREIHRVLRPNGQIGILEANQPDGLSGALYTIYFRHILPLIGGLISGDRAAYRYLPASVAGFPRPPQMLALLAEAGFTDPAWDGYLLRAAGLYRATKP